MTQMTETRLLTLIKAYGAEPTRWPEEERADGEALLATSAAGQRAVREAETLDALLAKHVVAPADPSLLTRITAIPERRTTNWLADLRAFWPFEAIWRPAAGLVAAAIIGIVVGGSELPDRFTGAVEPDVATGDFAYAIIAAAGGDIEESLQ